jgi:hypothetical protein
MTRQAGGSDVPGHDVDLTESQRRHLQLCFSRLVEESEDLLDWVDAQPISAEERDDARTTLLALVRHVRELAARLDLPLQREAQDPYRYMRAWASIWWASILDCRPSALRGYGPVSSSATAALGGEVERLAERLAHIKTLADRGERRERGAAGAPGP